MDWIDLYKVNTRKSRGLYMATFNLPCGIGFIWPKKELRECINSLSAYLPNESEDISLVSVRPWAGTSIKYKTGLPYDKIEEAAQIFSTSRRKIRILQPHIQ